MTIKISKTHKKFADHLDDQTALEYPERFLGPNWKDVLNFWIYLDTLSVYDFEIFNMCNWDLEDLWTSRCLAIKAAEYTIGRWHVRHSASATGTWLGSYATCELIGSHNLKSLNFLPLFLNL
jgi:hypothetical protein